MWLHPYCLRSQFLHSLLKLPTANLDHSNKSDFDENRGCQWTKNCDGYFLEFLHCPFANRELREKMADVIGSFFVLSILI